MTYPVHGGIVHNMDIDAYHSSAGISKTGLDRIERSPWHYWNLTLNPKRPPERERAGQLEGSLAHCAILEPGEFDKRYAVGPDASRATKAWKDFEAALDPGVIGIKSDQYETAMRQAESVRYLPDVRDALSRGVPEVSAYWTDQETGVLCRCRPDWVHPVGDDAVILLDVKTYSSADPREFYWQAKRKRYDVQNAFYSDGFALASGQRVLAFIFVVVEVEFPFAASAVMLDEIKVDEARVAYRRNINTYSQCLQTGEWPSYSNAIELI